MKRGHVVALILVVLFAGVATAFAASRHHHVGASFTASSASSVLVGNTSVQGASDGGAGTSEAFGYTATVSGTATNANVYLTSTGGVQLGLYADASGQPGALLDHASVTSNARGWVSLPLNAGAQITAGTRYWLAIAARTSRTTVTYRDMGTGGSNLDYSGNGLANPYQVNGHWNSNPASVYVGGTTSSSSSSSSSTTSTTTTTTPTSTTSTTTTPTSTTTTSSTTTSSGNCFAAPASCGYPDAGSNDGAHGTLTPASGQVTLSTPGMTYQNVALNGYIIVNANNVTINNVQVTDPGGAGIILGGGFGIACHTGTLIENVTIQGTGNTASTAITDGVYNEGCGNGGSVSATGTKIYCHDSQQTCWNGSGQISDSYLITDVPINGNHTEPVFETGGDAGVQLNHDTLLNPIPQTADVFESVEGGQSQYNTITNSLLAGGGYIVYAGDGATDPTPTNAPPVVSGNRIARCSTAPFGDRVSGGGATCSGSGLNGADSAGYYPNGGYFGMCPACEGQGSGSHTTWTNNVWDDTGATIPHP